MRPWIAHMYELLESTSGETTDVSQALANGGRWVRAFNKNVVVMPNGEFVGAPKKMKGAKYKAGNPAGKSAVMRGGGVPRQRRKSSLRKMSDRKLDGQIKRLNKALKRGRKIAQSVNRDMGELEKARKDARGERKKRRKRRS